MKILAHRLGDGPIITPHMDLRMGDNVNGPSLIRVPEWVPNPLGRYYLYFGHHDGRYIRLAYADEITGPWRTFEAGVLPLADSHFRGHIASPDVLVDHEAQNIRLYFHGADVPTHEMGPQFTRVALSHDGIQFTAQPNNLGGAYMRVVRYQAWHYAIAMPGIIYRSKDGLTHFEEGPNPFEPNMRHAGLLVRDDQLLVFYTRIGDRPERVLCSTMDMTQDWLEWRPTAPVPVLAPEKDYEGGALELRASVVGMAEAPVRALRDPALFEDNGETLLLYSVAGERGIALARLFISASARS